MSMARFTWSDKITCQGMIKVSILAFINDVASRNIKNSSVTSFMNDALWESDELKPYYNLAGQFHKQLELWKQTLNQGCSMQTTFIRCPTHTLPTSLAEMWWTLPLITLARAVMNMETTIKEVRIVSFDLYLNGVGQLNSVTIYFSAHLHLHESLKAQLYSHRTYK